MTRHVGALGLAMLLTCSVAGAQARVESISCTQATLSVGSHDGVAVGMTIVVMRLMNPRPEGPDAETRDHVAVLRVATVADRSSVADIVDVDAGSELLVGDWGVFDARLAKAKAEVLALQAERTLAERGEDALLAATRGAEASLALDPHCSRANRVLHDDDVWMIRRLERRSRLMSGIALDVTESVAARVVDPAESRVAHATTEADSRSVSPERNVRPNEKDEREVEGRVLAVWSSGIRAGMVGEVSAIRVGDAGYVLEAPGRRIAKIEVVAVSGGCVTAKVLRSIGQPVVANAQVVVEATGATTSRARPAAPKPEALPSLREPS